MFGTHKHIHNTSWLELEQVYQYKYLVLLFDPAFTWDQHADII